MKVTATPTESSSVVLEVEVPAQRVHAAVDEAVRHQQRRVRVPGFRPGKVPRQMLERAMGINRADPRCRTRSTTTPVSTSTSAR